MARLEAVLTGLVDGPQLRAGLAKLSAEVKGHLEWLDQSNAELKLVCGEEALLITALLELSAGHELRLLLSSSEGMTTGAPHSQAALETLLLGLQALAAEALISYRSDRDGPLRQVAVIGTAAEAVSD